MTWTDRLLPGWDRAGQRFGNRNELGIFEDFVAVISHAGEVNTDDLNTGSVMIWILNLFQKLRTQRSIKDFLSIWTTNTMILCLNGFIIDKRHLACYKRKINKGRVIFNFYERWNVSLLWSIGVKLFVQRAGVWEWALGHEKLSLLFQSRD